MRRRRQNNQIRRLKNEQGIWINQGAELDSLMVNHFKEIFKSYPGNVILVIECLQRKISESQNNLLVRRVTLEEVKAAMFDMKPDKSPGLDGMNPGFFQHFWDILGIDIVKFCEEFVQTRKFPEGWNQTQLVLIPKIPKPKTMGDPRPIALCNILYKTVAKVLANRMKLLLRTLIFENQSAFVLGKLITDSIMVSYETQHYLNRKMQGKVGYAGLKLDMSKAYDRVEWNLLKAILNKLGFFVNFIALL